MKFFLVLYLAIVSADGSVNNEDGNRVVAPAVMTLAQCKAVGEAWASVGTPRGYYCLKA